ncbi:MAG: secretin N-terminal domain-containing protein [Pirellulaceae bacterium]
MCPFRRSLATRLVTLLPWALMAFLCISAATVHAAEAAFVGMLSVAVDDRGARHLELSDEVREKLRRLIDRRESEAINLALSIKDLPPDVRAERLAPFVAESERQGMELLTQEQRSKLNQLRLQRTGMVSLSETETAQMLELTSEQREAVNRLLADRATAMTRGGESERRVARDNYERQLRALLSSAQKATWDQMAGLGPGPMAPAEGPTVGAEPASSAEAGEDDTVAAPVTENEPPAATETEGQVGAAAGEAEDRVMVEQPDADATADESVLPRDPAAQSSVAPSDGGLEAADPKAVKLRFNFRYQPWEDVLDWLAEQADLSLQSTLVPEGTFNYSDSREYTPTEAIDLINGVLLTQGYTLVRRGRLLTVLNLDDEVPDVLVEFVPVEKIDDRGEYELIKTVFHLAKMEPTDAEQEIQQLLGPGRKMIVMPKSRQILVTETAGKLRTIRDVIERAENPSGNKDKGVAELKLQFVSPEEVLLIARPLLGLEEGKNVGEEISIAIDTLGTRLFATGDKEKIQILEDLVERVDNKREVIPSAVATEQPQLLTHQIRAADPTESLAVMQTLLAGLPDVRMSLDSKTNKIIALARPSEHRTIAETIKQLEGDSPRFEVIQLRKIDPQLAVLTINNFFGNNDAEDPSSGAIKVDADPTSMKLYVRATQRDLEQVRTLIEKLEGSGEGGAAGSTLRFIPMTGDSALSAVEMAERLWRGTNQIRMTAPSDSGSGIFDLRTISPEEPAGTKPPGGAPATSPMPRTKQTATEPTPETPAEDPTQDKVAFSRDDVRPHAAMSVRFVSLHPAEMPLSLALAEDSPQEPTATEQGPDAQPVGDSTPAPATEEPAPATEEPALPTEEIDLDNESDSLPEFTPESRAAEVGDRPGQGSDIHIEFTPNGILISSDDTAALDEFEDLLRTVAGPQLLAPGKNFTVYFLKHCKADVARQLISDILGGSSSDNGGGSLVGDVASNLMGGGGGILGALLAGGGGGASAVTTVQATGPVSIVADSRLNCLLVQSLPVDAQLIEQLLKVIDREGSITDIFTAGKPHIIPVIYVQAEEVARIVREAFASRIAGAAGGQGGGGQPNPADFIRALRGGRGGGNAEVKTEEAKMTIAVDARSNALIVTAPEQLFLEVQELVKLIDEGGANLDEDVQVVSLKKGNAEAVQKALAAIMGTTSSSSSNASRATASNQRGSAQGGAPFGGATSGDIQQRMQFLQRMQESMGGQRGGGQGGRGGFQPGGGRGGMQPGGGRGGQGGGRGGQGGQGGGRRGG